MNVVAIGTSETSENFARLSTCPASLIPCPATISGRLAESSRSAASAIFRSYAGGGGGENFLSAASSTVAVWTFMGMSSHTGPNRPWVAS